jgi:hypothetical protein
MECALAEREGFEPPIRLPVCRISSAVHSTTLPPLQSLIYKAFQPSAREQTVAAANILQTFLLRGVLRPSGYGGLQGIVNPCRGIGLHAGEHVAVKVERDPNLAVAKPLAGDFWMHAARQ